MAGSFAPALRPLQCCNRPKPPLGFFIVAGHGGDCHLAAEPVPATVQLLLPADHHALLLAGQSITPVRYARGRQLAARPSPPSIGGHRSTTSTALKRRGSRASGTGVNSKRM